MRLLMIALRHFLWLWLLGVQPKSILASPAPPLDTWHLPATTTPPPPPPLPLHPSFCHLKSPSACHYPSDQNHHPKSGILGVEQQPQHPQPVVHLLRLLDRFSIGNNHDNEDNQSPVCLSSPTRRKCIGSPPPRRRDPKASLVAHAMRKSVSFSTDEPTTHPVPRTSVDRSSYATFIDTFWLEATIRTRNAVGKFMVLAAKKAEREPESTYTAADLTIHHAFSMHHHHHFPSFPPSSSSLPPSPQPEASQRAGSQLVNVVLAEDIVFEAIRDQAVRNYSKTLNISWFLVSALRKAPTWPLFTRYLPHFKGILFMRLIISAHLLLPSVCLQLPPNSVGSRLPSRSWYGQEVDEPLMNPVNGSTAAIRVLLSCQSCKYIQPFTMDPMTDHFDAVVTLGQPILRVVEVVRVERARRAGSLPVAASSPALDSPFVAVPAPVPRVALLLLEEVVEARHSRCL